MAPTMPPTAFRAALRRLNVTQVGFARAVGVDPTTVRRWLRGAHPVPHWVALLLEAQEYVSLEELSRGVSLAKSTT